MQEIPSGRRHERVKQLEDDAPYLVVEIGSGEEPLPATLGTIDPYRKHLRDNPDIHYFGVEKNSHRMDKGRGKLAMMDQVRGWDPDERVKFLNQSGEKLPFPPESVAEVILRDVLSDPDIKAPEKTKMLNEAARILRPEGILRVIERISPLSRDTIRSIIGSAGGALTEVDESS